MHIPKMPVYSRACRCSAALLAGTAALSACASHPLFIPARSAAQEQISSAVSLADLDLSLPSGLAAAHGRLELAAQRLCSRFSDDRKVSAWYTYKECVREAAASALLQLPEPGLVARGSTRNNAADLNQVVSH